MIKIYMYTNIKDNNKKYIGQTERSLQERAGSNFINYRECSRFYTAIQEFGKDAFISEILAKTIDTIEANNLEELFIKKFNTTNPEYGYNIQPGGNKFIMNDNVKKRISENIRSSKKFKENNASAHCKKIVAINIITKEFKAFNSIVEAGKQTNTCSQNISQVCNGMRKSANKLHWSFVNSKTNENVKHE